MICTVLGTITLPLVYTSIDRDDRSRETEEWQWRPSHVLQCCTITFSHGFHIYVSRVLQVSLAELASEEDIVKAVTNHIQTAKGKPRVSGDITEDDMKNSVVSCLIASSQLVCECQNFIACSPLLQPSWHCMS